MPIFSKWTTALGDFRPRYPNYWDAVALCLVLALLVTLSWGAKGMTIPYHLGEQIPISLNPEYLPYYALRSVLRMGMALICSLAFTLVVGTIAAKSVHAARFLIPLIDILQSVPVLGYLSITVVAFIALFPNSMLGPECAAIFAIFTAQVWNITLSFYQNLRSVPDDLKEAARVFQLSGWQRFWRLDVCFAMPGLLWNVMVSMSASWFFVVASEAISVNNQNITLPGIGSYIALAVQHADIKSVVYAILTMFIVILLYDQLIFRPLNEWITKFKFEQEVEETRTNSWVVYLFQHVKWLRWVGRFSQTCWDAFVNFPIFLRKPIASHRLKVNRWNWQLYCVIGWYVFLLVALTLSSFIVSHFVFSEITWSEARHVIYLGTITALRVVSLIILCSCLWIPLGVWIGLRPRWANLMQPVLQFLASFPVNLVYPIVVVMILKFQLDPNIWVSPLMVLGSQAYIAFNVVAGARTLPQDLHQVSNSLNVRGWLWWRRFILPGIFPYYVTGAITAAGGAWNASIIAEVIIWGHTKITATGLGAYITQQTSVGDFPRLALGITVMCLFVLLINWSVWQPLYRVATERFKLM